MANFAVIVDNIVENVIVAENKESAEQIIGKTCIEYTDENRIGIGWIWDGINFINPNPAIEYTSSEEIPA